MYAKNAISPVNNALIFQKILANHAKEFVFYSKMNVLRHALFPTLKDKKINVLAVISNAKSVQEKKNMIVYRVKEIYFYMESNV